MKSFQTWWDSLPNEWRDSDDGCHRHKLARDAWNASELSTNSIKEECLKTLVHILEELEKVEPGNCVHRRKSIESIINMTLYKLDKANV